MGVPGRGLCPWYLEIESLEIPYPHNMNSGNAGCFFLCSPIK